MLVNSKTFFIYNKGDVVISSVYSFVDCSVPTRTSYVVLMSNTCLTNLNNKTVISTNVLSISLQAGYNTTFWSGIFLKVRVSLNR